MLTIGFGKHRVSRVQKPRKLVRSVSRDSGRSRSDTGNDRAGARLIDRPRLIPYRSVFNRLGVPHEDETAPLRLPNDDREMREAVTALENLGMRPLRTSMFLLIVGR